MKKILYILFFLSTFKPVFCQLLPSIGLSSQPANSATICNEPWYLGSFYTTGLSTGNTVPDFKLYGLTGDSIVLSNKLALGKPVVLIAGSLTCPIFRNKVNTINQIISTYSSAINVYVIYTLEAHPTDTSVYFGYVNVTTQNTNSGVLFPQPTTYGARKQLVDTMSYWVNLNASVFIDGPCNQWWKTFGPAPNNAYIIKPNGVIASKHGWFDKSPDKIFCDIDSVLSITSGSCITTTAPGNFTLNVINTFVSGDPGKLLYDYAKVINTESVGVTVSVKKLQKNHPLGWQTAFCADVCYSTSDDSIMFSLPPYDTLLLSLDFFTDAIPDSGSVKVGFRNPNKPNNSFVVRFRASTLPQDVGVLEYKKNTLSFSMSPNPATEQTLISTDEKEFAIIIHDLLGREIYTSKNNQVINTANFKSSIYYVSLKANNNIRSLKLIVLN